jgi:hypothetical protein
MELEHGSKFGWLTDNEGDAMVVFECSPPIHSCASRPVAQLLDAVEEQMTRWAPGVLGDDVGFDRKIDQFGCYYVGHLVNQCFLGFGVCRLVSNFPGFKEGIPGPIVVGRERQ